MNRSSLGFFLIFFIAYASTELLLFCNGSRPFSYQYSAEQKRNSEEAVRSLLRNAEEEERVDVNRFNRAKGVYGGDNAFRHKAERIHGFYDKIGFHRTGACSDCSTC
ncbi:PREDICTED: uncharacterized protein LOC104819990 [Tarenaya hassleriana]|uniref:uncharacterized protein LOC104819990 n=1 Tax=Tarenaya hassleriana TaxID=28532 RepID=UPI00053C97CC|nr:PREDICTED: uncharacterized protein LOC104819990 [Tarenaya hassleriana]